MSLTPYIKDADFTLYNGDAREVLAELPDESVHCCLTSPPFFGLRSYLDDEHADKPKEIGLEQSPEEWVASLVAVFDEVRRVLRKDGTLWVECGDSYNAYNGNRGETGSTLEGRRQHLVNRPEPSRGLTTAAAKPKDLIGQPFLLAFALREAGWYWRNVCIWAKPNCMPESTRDRFTVAHSYVLLFSKSPRYFFDQEAVRESYEYAPELRYGRVGAYQENAMGPKGPDGRHATNVKQAGYSIQHRDGERWPNSGRNARTVWTIPTEPLPFEHYAAFPQALAERIIKAGTSEKGCCPECGAPWVREVESELVKSPVHGAGSTVRGRGEGTDTNGWAGEAMPRLNRQVTTTGWRSTCGCLVGLSGFSQVPCTVLDPFLGSGTSALVARRLGRKCIGVELSEAYCELAARRTQQLALLPDQEKAV